MPTIPDVDVADLSTDQKLLLDFGIANESNNVNEKLLAQKPVPVSHARWLTTGIRILRLYISSDLKF